ncbi:hypothetical protein KY362_03365 [Candidatus Woesearchaeota archaeon]|nr:hypothetical protein [Candidatus Woesearchaeota archaeon]
MGNETVMVVDGGARGHALARAYLKSPHVKEVVVTPGNTGMLEPGITIYPKTSLKDAESFLSAAKELKPSLVDVAQDDALAAGTVDKLVAVGFRTFGPTKAAARLEWDKEWAREVMKKSGVKVPEYQAFDQADKRSVDYAVRLLMHNEKVFFKIAGLLAGKGVVSAVNAEEAEEAYTKVQKMNSPIPRVLVEAGLKGEELSFFGYCGKGGIAGVRPVQDNKRVWNGDKGPNTGGMGCHQPAKIGEGLEWRMLADQEMIRKEMELRGIPYEGIFYAGLMKDYLRERPAFVEINSRGGDPELPLYIQGIQNDYFELMIDILEGRKPEIEEDDKTRVLIVGASAGYPGGYEKGKRVFIDKHNLPEDLVWFSAGLRRDGDNFYTAGGRLFDVIATGDDILEARFSALQAMACFHVAGGGLHYRTDIAERDLQRFLQRHE